MTAARKRQPAALPVKLATATLAGAMADLRQAIVANIVANGHDLVVRAGEPCDLAATARQIEALARSCAGDSHEPHPLAPTVSLDARPICLEIAAWAMGAVIELDRRVLAAHRSKP